MSSQFGDSSHRNKHTIRYNNSLFLLNDTIWAHCLYFATCFIPSSFYDVILWRMLFWQAYKPTCLTLVSVWKAFVRNLYLDYLNFLWCRVASDLNSISPFFGGCRRRRIRNKVQEMGMSDFLWNISTYFGPRSGRSLFCSGTQKADDEKDGWFFLPNSLFAFSCSVFKDIIIMPELLYSRFKYNYEFCL